MTPKPRAGVVAQAAPQLGMKKMTAPKAPQPPLKVRSPLPRPVPRNVTQSDSVQMMAYWILGSLVAAAGAAAIAVLTHRYLNRDLRRLREIHRTTGQNDPVLNNILTETLSNVDVPGRVRVSGRGSDYPKGETRRATEGPQASRTYRVLLDRSVTEQDKRSSYLFHELTHVSADRNYSMNVNESYFNVHHPGGSANPDSHVTAQISTYRVELEIARLQVESDSQISDSLRQYVLGRLDYIGGKPHQEFDTVINELLLYLHLKQVPTNSDTYQAIRKLANEAYRRRLRLVTQEEERRRVIRSQDPSWQGQKASEWESFLRRHQETPSYIS